MFNVFKVEKISPKLKGGLNKYNRTSVLWFKYCNKNYKHNKNFYILTPKKVLAPPAAFAVT